MHAAIDELNTKGTIVKRVNISLQDYFEYWYQNYVMITLKYNTQENYHGIIDNHIYPYLGNFMLKEVGPAQLQDLLNQEFKNGFAKKYIVYN